ncbi:hypothetical protein F5Y11DRAFT_339127 [Daldinia sp. FL1419]|nr:hypothetical protein F5Y11DRAFT_339127 [Daldinia sp. FL1419]
MDEIKTRTSRIEIQLPSKPPPYRPGDGPALAPLRIQPEHDSNAFIVDKRVLPDTAPNGELKLHMYYVVGWPDLPAARVSILATQIYDYVSPRAVEDFEYKALLERDAEEERLEAEKRRILEIAAKKKAVASALKPPAIPSVLGQKRRGRPSKAELQSRQLKRQANIGTSQRIEVVLPPATTSGPSLSTPKKKPVGELATDPEEDVDEEDSENAIYRQLCGYESPSEDMDMDDDVKDGDTSLDNAPETMSSGSEFRSYAKALWLNKDSTSFKRTNGNLTLKSSTTHVPVPEILLSLGQSPSKSSSTRTDNHPRVTPIPAPPSFNEMDTNADMSQTSGTKYSTTPVPVPTPFKSSKEASQPNLPDLKHPITPVPVPSWPHLANNKGESSAKASPLPSTATSPHRGFTPAGRSSGKWPSAQPHLPNDISSPLNTQTTDIERKESSHPKKKPPKPKPTPQKQSKQTEVWVVKRLEGDKVVNVDGKRVRYFKVRWAGDWPPDQNPTWEPEENITPALVKLYMKKKAGRHTAASSKKGDKNDASSSHRPTLKRKYSSVAEAFAGEEDELGESGQNDESYSSQGGNYENTDDEGEEMLVVAAEQETSPSRRGPRPRPKPEDLGAVFMRDLAAAMNLRDGDTHRGPR